MNTVVASHAKTFLFSDFDLTISPMVISPVSSFGSRVSRIVAMSSFSRSNFGTTVGSSSQTRIEMLLPLLTHVNQVPQLDSKLLGVTTYANVSVSSDREHGHPRAEPVHLHNDVA